MDASCQLEVMDGIGVFRVIGIFRFQQVVALVTAAIAQARESGLGKLVIVAMEMGGFEPPSLSERHWMVRQWVEASQAKLKIAMVIQSSFIDAEKFGIVAAANFGVTADVFTSEDEAFGWIRGLA